MEIRILDPNSSLDEMIEVIEDNIHTTTLTREEISKLKLQSKRTKRQDIVIQPKKKEITEKEPYCDIDFEEEMEYYLTDYKSLREDNLEEDLLSILPSKKTYRYKDIILRLIAESLKEIKEVNELISRDNFNNEELADLRSVILLEKKKISILKEHLKHKDEVETEEEINNEIILVPSLTGNVKLIEDLEHIHPSNYEAFLELVESIKNGTFKGVKRFTNNVRFAGISEVRGFQVRIAFARIGKNKYALITAFTKKCDNDKGYRDSLTQKLSDYRLQEEKLKALADNEEFLRENELNVGRLYNLLGKVEEPTLKEVL